MTEPAPEAAPANGSAGALLRGARERQGLTLEALAEAIKVAPRKLQALEAERLDELPDIAFTRALAKTVCRALNIDPEPVLASLPSLPAAGSVRLEHINGGLRTPFRERSAHHGARAPALFSRPLLWTLAVLLLAVIAVYAVRTEMFRDTADALRGAVNAVDTVPVADVASAVAQAVQPVPAREPPPELPAPPGMVVEALTLPMPEAPGVLVLRASAQAWVDVQDASGRTLVSRSLHAGETLNLNGALPMRATIGNVAATSVTFRGAPVDLEKVNKGNVARLELK
jgi:cytoskeleton protein RodZ